MSEITITCDRCGKVVHGMLYQDPNCKKAFATAGYYILTEHSAWKKYARWEEEQICDECMHSDPMYMHDYPNATVPGNRATSSYSS